MKQNKLIKRGVNDVMKNSFVFKAISGYNGFNFSGLEFALSINNGKKIKNPITK